MFLSVMITSFFQKPIEVLSLNCSSDSLGYVILQDAFYCLACVLFGHNFPEKASRVNFYSQPFRHWSAAVSAFKVHAEGKEKNEEYSNEPCQSLHCKTWPIPSQKSKPRSNRELTKKNNKK